MLLANLIK